MDLLEIGTPPVPSRRTLTISNNITNNNDVSLLLLSAQKPKVLTVSTPTNVLSSGASTPSKPEPTTARKPSRLGAVSFSARKGHSTVQEVVEVSENDSLNSAPQQSSQTRTAPKTPWTNPMVARSIRAPPSTARRLKDDFETNVRASLESEESVNWAARIEALLKTETMIRRRTVSLSRCVRGISLQLASAQSQVSMAACACVYVACNESDPEELLKFAREITPALASLSCSLAPGCKTQGPDEGALCLLTLYRTLPGLELEIVLDPQNGVFFGKNTIARRTGAFFVESLLTDPNETRIAPMVQALTRYFADSDGETRATSRRALKLLYGKDPSSTQSLFHSLLTDSSETLTNHLLHVRQFALEFPEEARGMQLEKWCGELLLPARVLTPTLVEVAVPSIPAPEEGVQEVQASPVIREPSVLVEVEAEATPQPASHKSSPFGHLLLQRKSMNQHAQLLERRMEDTIKSLHTSNRALLSLRLAENLEDLLRTRTATVVAQPELQLLSPRNVAHAAVWTVVWMASVGAIVFMLSEMILALQTPAMAPYVHFDLEEFAAPQAVALPQLDDVLVMEEPLFVVAHQAAESSLPSALAEEVVATVVVEEMPAAPVIETIVSPETFSLEPFLLVGLTLGFGLAVQRLALQSGAVVAPAPAAETKEVEEVHLDRTPEQQKGRFHAIQHEPRSAAMPVRSVVRSRRLLEHSATSLASVEGGIQILTPKKAVAPVSAAKPKVVAKTPGRVSARLSAKAQQEKS